MACHKCKCPKGSCHLRNAPRNGPGGPAKGFGDKVKEKDQEIQKLKKELAASRRQHQHKPDGEGASAADGVPGPELPKTEEQHLAQVDALQGAIAKYKECGLADQAAAAQSSMDRLEADWKKSKQPKKPDRPEWLWTKHKEMGKKLENAQKAKDGIAEKRAELDKQEADLASKIAKYEKDMADLKVRIRAASEPDGPVNPLLVAIEMVRGNMEGKEGFKELSDQLVQIAEKVGKLSPEPPAASPVILPHGSPKDEVRNEDMEVEEVDVETYCDGMADKLGFERLSGDARKRQHEKVSMEKVRDGDWIKVGEKLKRKSRRKCG